MTEAIPIQETNQNKILKQITAQSLIYNVSFAPLTNTNLLFLCNATFVNK